MALVTGPLLSFGASGQIAKTQVYSRWKGRAYVRRYVVPANPRSADQTTTRNTFTWLNNVWKIAPADFVAPWTAAARGQVLTNRNLFIKRNNGILREETDLALMILSPGAKGGLTVAPAITFGNDMITIDLVAPDPLPSGWTIVEAVGVAIRDQDPQTGVLYTIEAGTDATSTYSVVLSGLAAGDWAAGGWFVYQRSALATDLAYGSSVAEVGTVT
jgi:hypothetical protein